MGHGFHLDGEFAVAFSHSAVNYTTLGYGDIVMSPHWRLLGPLEAASGTLAFGWSSVGGHRRLMPDLPVQYGVAVVFVWAFAVQAGLPVPAVPMLLGAGALSGSGHMNIPTI